MATRKFLAALWPTVTALFSVTALFCMGVGCDGEPEGSGFVGGASEDPLSIVGEYVDDFGSSHHITEAQWRIDEARFAILEFSNADRRLIAANAPENTYFPGKFSRFDWATAEGTLWYCQIAYDKPSLDDARATPAPDASKLESSGCSGFPWSRLTPNGSR